MNLMIISKESHKLKEVLESSFPNANIYVSNVDSFVNDVTNLVLYSGVIIITDEDNNSNLWNDVEKYIDDGFIIALSNIDEAGIVAVDAEANVHVKKINSVDRIIRYIEASLKDGRSKLSEIVNSKAKHIENQLAENFEIPPEAPFEMEKGEDMNRQSFEAEVPEDVLEISNVQNSNEQVEVINDNQVPNKIEIDELINEKKDELKNLEIQILQRKRLQKMLFDLKSENECKVVAVWSPSPKQGVTTFAINYAHSLAEDNYKVILMEGLRSVPYLKSKLTTYTEVPPEWKSFANCMRDEFVNMERARWLYKGVMYFPLEKNDMELDWHSDSLESYVKTASVVDLVLIDLENGPMQKYTEDMLKNVDELWVIVDDAIHENVSWGKFIMSVKKSVPSSRLIFNKTFDFSKYEEVQSFLQYEKIYLLPDLTYDVMKNNYMMQPLYYYSEVDIITPYSKLSEDLLGPKVREKTNGNIKKRYTPEKKGFAKKMLTKVKEMLV